MCVRYSNVHCSSAHLSGEPQARHVIIEGLELCGIPGAVFLILQSFLEEMETGLYRTQESSECIQNNLKAVPHSDTWWNPWQQAACIENSKTKTTSDTRTCETRVLSNRWLDIVEALLLTECDLRCTGTSILRPSGYTGLIINPQFFYSCRQNYVNSKAGSKRQKRKSTH